jgi:hypothetical protein
MDLAHQTGVRKPQAKYVSGMYSRNRELMAPFKILDRTLSLSHGGAVHDRSPKHRPKSYGGSQSKEAWSRRPVQGRHLDYIGTARASTSTARPAPERSFDAAIG